MLKPVRVFPDPFNKLPNILVLCEVYNHDWSPAGTNHRFSCAKTMTKAAEEKPWFGLEQEYTLLAADGKFSNNFRVFTVYIKVIPTDGPSRATLVHKVLTTVQSVITTSMAAT